MSVHLFCWPKCDTHIINPPPPSFLLGRTTLITKFWKGRIRKKWVPGGGGGGDLKSSWYGYLPGRLPCFLSKKIFKENIALRAQCQMLILFCLRQKTNYCLVLWHFGSVKPLACKLFEISISVIIVKHVQHVGIVRAFCLPGGNC